MPVVVDGTKVVALTDTTYAFEGTLDEFTEAYININRQIRKEKAAEKVREQRKEWNRQYYLRRKAEGVAATSSSSV